MIRINIREYPSLVYADDIVLLVCFACVGVWGLAVKLPAAGLLFGFACSFPGSPTYEANPSRLGLSPGRSSRHRPEPGIPSREAFGVSKDSTSISCGI